MAVPQPSHVYKLVGGVAAVEAFLQTHPKALLSMTHPLVPRCQRFSPVYEEIAQALSDAGSDIKCAQIDRVGVSDLQPKFGATTFPTVVLCDGIDSFKTYCGALKKADILAYLERQRLPPVSDVSTVSDLEKLKNDHDTVIAGFINFKDEERLKTFIAVAHALHSDFVFGLASSPALAALEEVDNPSIVVYKSTAEIKLVLECSENVEKLTKAVKVAARPLIAEFRPELYESELSGNLPLGYLFVSSEAQRLEIAESMVAVARRYRGQIQLGTVDVDIFLDLSDEMHVESNQWPAFAIHETMNNLKYPFRPDVSRTTAQFSVHEVGSFVEAFLAGNLKPTIKSQPILDANSSPVKEVVGLSYADVVLNNDRDVLVEFYTPWCQPCKTLLPQYEELAKQHAETERARTQVTIAKIDFEANDVPDKDIRGFPWFKLYPAGKKDAPLTYGGDRTVAAWAAFIEEHGTHKVKLDF